MTSIRSAIEKPGIIGKDDESRNAARARRFAGAGEQSVDVGDAAVGDPGFLAIDDDSPSPSWRAEQAIAATSEPASFSDNAKAASHSPDRAFGRTAALQLGGARDGDRAGAQPLHREGEIGEAVVPGERLARQAGASAKSMADASPSAARPLPPAGRPRQARARACGTTRRHRHDRSSRAAPEATKASSRVAKRAMATARRTASRSNRAAR